MANKPQKILYLVTLSEWGGAQKYVFDLSVHFREEGHQVSVAVGGKKNGELIKRLLKVGIKIYYIKKLERKINFYNDWFTFWSLYKLMKKMHPDIVHLNSSKAGSLGAVTARMACVKKIIYTVHGLILNEPLNFLKKKFYHLAEWLSAKFKTDIICVSDLDRKSILKFGIAPASKITVIHNGIDIKNIQFLPREQARLELEKIMSYQLSATSYKLIGTIANLYATKGLPYLVEAVRESLTIEKNLKFIVIGEGPERKKLEELISDYKLQNNLFLVGNVQDATKYLKAFDLFVLSSVKEGLVYSLIEASAAGLPIVATRVGGNAEIITHAVNGILVKPMNFSALSEAIINTLNNHAASETLGQAAKQNAQKFDLQTMITKTTSIYEKNS